MRIILAKLVNLVKCSQHSIFLGICILFIFIISFNLGRINAFKKSPIKVMEGANIYSATGANPKSETQNSNQIQNPKFEIKKSGRVVASKNSDKYHYETCTSWGRIKKENQIWFESAKEAELKGYLLAGNCLP
jgi:hypothetical protein